MQNKEVHAHEPRIQVVKRGEDMPILKSWFVRAVAIVAALLVCSLVIVMLTGINPIQFFKTMVVGSFGTERNLWKAAQNLAMLLCISLAVTPAFKMKFWNIGAEGQALVGCIASAAIMINFADKFPNNIVMLVVMAVASILAGVVWGLIPAIFKAYFNTNETLFTLMMNYVAIQLTTYFVLRWENPKNSSNVGIINMKTMSGWFPWIANQKYLLNIIIVAIIVIIMYIYLKYSKHGYEISVVGESQNTARYIGINVKKVIIRTMAFSGALCGVTGWLLVAGTHHTINADIVGGMGFTAIMVSWLAKFNPIVMIFVSGLIVFLQQGAAEIVTQFTAFQLNESISDIITGIILFFIIGSEFFVRYKINRRKVKED